MILSQSGNILRNLVHQTTTTTFTDGNLILKNQQRCSSSYCRIDDYQKKIKIFQFLFSVNFRIRQQTPFPWPSRSVLRRILIIYATQQLKSNYSENQELHNNHRHNFILLCCTTKCFKCLFQKALWQCLKKRERCCMRNSFSNFFMSSNEYIN